MADVLSYFSAKSQAKEKMFGDENIQIFHDLQILFTKASIVGLIFLGLSLAKKVTFLLFHQVLICGTYFVP